MATLVTPHLTLVDQRTGTLRALLARIEDMRWPDPPEWGVRELECDIAVGTGLFEHRRCGIEPQYRPVGQERWLLPGNEPVPRYLRSLDAAMTLKLPGWAREVFVFDERSYARVDLVTAAGGSVGAKFCQEAVATTAAWLQARLA